MAIVLKSFKNFFLLACRRRVASIWNSLPDNVVALEILGSLKRVVSSGTCNMFGILGDLPHQGRQPTFISIILSLTHGAIEWFGSEG